MKTLIFLLFPFLLSAQLGPENVLLSIDDTYSPYSPKNDFLQLNTYKWNKQKTIGFSVLIIASIADGLVEGWEFGGRRAWEIKFGVAPRSFWGRNSYLRAFKNFDPAQGPKNIYTKMFGAWDFYHLADDIRKFGYIGGGIMITIGAKGQKWQHILLDAVIYSIGTTLAKSGSMMYVMSR